MCFGRMVGFTCPSSMSMFSVCSPLSYNATFLSEVKSDLFQDESIPIFRAHKLTEWLNKYENYLLRSSHLHLVEHFGTYTAFSHQQMPAEEICYERMMFILMIQSRCSRFPFYSVIHQTQISYRK